MKRVRYLLALVLPLCLTFVSCEKNNPSKQIVGTWKFSNHQEVSDVTATLVFSRNGTGSYHLIGNSTLFTDMIYELDYDIIEWSLDNSRLSVSLYNKKTHKVDDTVWRVISLTSQKLVLSGDIIGEGSFTKD